MDTVTVEALEYEPRCHSMLAKLVRIRSLDLSGGQDATIRYYGMVRDHRSIDADGLMNGCSLGVPDSPLHTTVAVGPVGDPRDVPAHSWDRDSSYAGWYAGHELAHTLGRRHPGVCGQAADDPEAGRFGKIGVDITDVVGFDPLTARVYSPTQWYDVMTYCKYRWIGERTYTGILERLRAEEVLANKASPDRPADADSVAIATGFVEPPTTVEAAIEDLGQTSGREWRALNSSIEVVAVITSLGSNYGRILTAFTTGGDAWLHSADRQELRTLSEDETVTIEFQPTVGELKRFPALIMANAMRTRSGSLDGARPQLTGEGWVHTRVPGFSGEGWIRLVRKGKVLHRIWKSASAPTLQGVTRVLVGTEHKTDGHRFSWTADDPDDDRSEITVYAQASFDGGLTWEVVNQTREAQVLIPCRILAGRESARVRLVASDAVNQIVAYSGGELVQPVNDPCRGS